MLKLLYIKYISGYDACIKKIETRFVASKRERIQVLHKISVLSNA